MVGILVLALSTLVFSAVQHGTVFQLSSGEASYTLENNVYDTNTVTSGVRFSFTAPFDSAFYITISEKSGGSFNFYSCTDSTFSNCSYKKNLNGDSASFSLSYDKISKDSTLYYKVSDSDSKYSHKAQPFEIEYSTIPYINVKSTLPQCTTTVKSQIVKNANFIKFTAASLPGYRTDGWKIASGTAAVKDSLSNTISISATTDVLLELQCKEATIYPLKDTYTGFTFDNNSSTVEGKRYGIQTSFAADDSSYYTIVTQTPNSYSMLVYPDSNFYSYSASQSCGSSGYCRRTFYGAKDSSYYFFLTQSNSNYLTDSIYAKVEKAIKINADTSGSGNAYVGKSSRSYDSTYIAGDSIPLSASSNAEKFDHWEKVSGNCSFVDSKIYNTKLVANESCRIKAVFVPETRNPITEDEKIYTTAKDHSLGVNYSSGIRYYFTAKDSGAYVFNFENTAINKFNLYKYKDSTYKSQIFSKKVISISDTLYMNAGDSIFYFVSSATAKDSLDTIKVSYNKIKHFTVTSKSNSEHCLADTSITTFEGNIVTITGRSETGYRPNGWKFANGKKEILDSSAARIRFKIKSDISLQLNCALPNLIEIDNVWREYTINNNLYEKDPSVGIRFRYVAPTTDPYIVKAGDLGFNGSFYNYGTDSTFRNGKRLSIDKKYDQFYVEPQASGETGYFVISASNKNFYDSIVGIRAARALFVQIDTVIYKVAEGDSLKIKASIPIYKNFKRWEIVSGKGSFSSSTDSVTYYKPKTDSSKIRAVFQDIAIYKLTDKWSTFSLRENGVQTTFGNGIRTSYKAGDSAETFILQIKNPSKVSFRLRGTNDSTFSSGNNSTYTDSIKRILYTPTIDDSTYYFLFLPTDFNVPFDTIQVLAVKTSKITFDTTGHDTLKITSYFSSTAATLIPGDSVQIQVKSTTAHRFDHWKVVSGSCKLADSSRAVTTLYVTGDCQVKPESVSGVTYKITKAPTSYTTAKNYFTASPAYGVKFLFVAPDSGSYTFIASRAENKNVAYQRFSTSEFTGNRPTKSLNSTTATETVQMLKGDSAFFLIKNGNLADSLVPFWISYSTTFSTLTITADSNGRVNPTTYKQIYDDAKYGIYAYGNTNYRFDKWSIDSGKVKIDDVNAPRTLVSVTGNAGIRASYRESKVINLTQDLKTYNFQADYFNESNNYAIRFSWTPQDTGTYILEFESIDHLAGILSEYKDSTYASVKKNYPISGKYITSIKGEPNVTTYWSVRDSSGEAPDKDFKAGIMNRHILQVASSLQGTTLPKGDIKIVPGTDTSITAWAYGGYIFDKWVVDSGNVIIDNVKKNKARFAPKDSFSIVRPTFTIDLTSSPELQISNIDLTSHPSICTQVSVVDRNSGRALVGLDSTNFILFQDGKALPIQTTTLQEITGISVAMVVDESGSMNNVRQKAAKTALNNFINEMGAYDRAAIIGFHGDGETRVHQSMTSDADSLRAAINKLQFDGNTNINEGAYAGVRQIIGETNPTAIIVFSDGEDGSDILADEVINLAKKNNTTIYTIGLESKSLDPLQNLAIGTGGRYSYVASADSLADIYEDIHGSIQSQYVVCYDSPDKTLDNGKHEVVIKTNINGKSSADTITWRENFMPPRITLTKETQEMIGVSQEPGDSIVIGAYIYSQASINTAKIYLRQSSIPAKSFQATSMVQVNDSLWTFTIPAADVIGPGIDFYIIAEESTGLLGKTPTIPAPSREPYTIPIDNDVPVIQLASNDCIDTTSGSGKISFNISDSNGIYESHIYYKDSLEILFLENSMTRKSSGKQWNASIPAKYFREGSVEYYVRATDSTGTAVRWPKTRSNYLTACKVDPPDTTAPPVKETITLVNAEAPNANISRTTGKIGIRITTQSFSAKVDTVTASLKCLKSGDSESDIKMVEKKEGEYENWKPIFKDEFSAKKNNGSISCEVLDTLIATYKNPETKKSISDTVVINDFVDISYQFLEVKGDKSLDSVKTSRKANFRLRVTTTNPKFSKIDTISVKVFTHQGDSITVKAVETDTNSSIFDYKGTFYFEEDSLALKDNHLDAVFDFTKTRNRIKIQAQYAKDSSKPSKRDSLIVYSNFVPADSAEIYDKDLDGKADFVRVHFMNPLKENIESIDTVFWPKSGNGSEYRKVKASKIKIEKDSSWVEAKLEKTFQYGVTAADSAHIPYLRVTKTKSDFSQKVRVTDKVGAVPFKAKKRPGRVEVDEYLTPDVEIPPDTLVITMSEGIKRTGKKDAWKKLFRYSSSCEDTISAPLKVLGEPQVDSTGIEWKFVLADYSIMVGNCIKANHDAEYIDQDGNALGEGGARISGEDGTIYLYEVLPNPAVSGIGQKAEWISPDKNVLEAVPDTLSTVKVLSIAAYKAEIYIYDNQGQYVNHLKQKFGYNGELSDPLRGGSDKREKLGFLYWNQRTEKGRKVGTGVYIWQIKFRFKDGHTEERTLKTGVKRNAEDKE